MVSESQVSYRTFPNTTTMNWQGTVVSDAQVSYHPFTNTTKIHWQGIEKFSSPTKMETMLTAAYQLIYFMISSTLIARMLSQLRGEFHNLNGKGPQRRHEMACTTILDVWGNERMVKSTTDDVILVDVANRTKDPGTRVHSGDQLW